MKGLSEKLKALQRLSETEATEPVLDLKRELTRRKKLRAIAGNLRRSKNVQNRKLKTWLTADEYSEFEHQWRSQQDIRQDLAEKPDSLGKYELLLKKAIFFSNRSLARRSKKNAATNKQLSALAERYCERAIESLQEIYEHDPSIQAWFDRPLVFGGGSAITANVESLPRLVTSRSHERISDHYALMSKRDVKLDVVLRAIERIEEALRHRKIKKMTAQYPVTDRRVT